MPKFVYTDQWVTFSAALANTTHNRILGVIEDVCTDLLDMEVTQSAVAMIKRRLKTRFLTRATVQDLVRNGGFAAFQRAVWKSAVNTVSDQGTCTEEGLP